MQENRLNPNYARCRMFQEKPKIPTMIKLKENWLQHKMFLSSLHSIPEEESQALENYNLCIQVDKAIKDAEENNLTKMKN